METLFLIFFAVLAVVLIVYILNDNTKNESETQDNRKVSDSEQELINKAVEEHIAEMEQERRNNTVQSDLEDELSELKNSILSLLPGSLFDEIGDYLSEYTTVDYSKNLHNDDSEDSIKPLSSHITKEEADIIMSGENLTKLLAIMSDDGTREQTMVKFELLLGKREKTDDMLVIENKLRFFYRKMCKHVHEIYKKENPDIAAASAKNPNIARLASSTVEARIRRYFREDENMKENISKMTKIANEFGVSLHIVEQEEIDRYSNNL